MDPIVSVVIPAHDEEAVLAGGLRLLLEGVRRGEFEVIVVANACSDRTAEVARAASVRVIETAEPGKANALRLGDAACRTFPRVYLDADVELTSRSIRALLEALAEPGVLACAPVPVWDLRGAGPVARRLHRVHDHLVAPARGLAGVGCYALNEGGHARMFPLPDVISDDGWAQASFAPAERRAVAAATTRVRPARTVRAHLRRRVRVRLGNRQLADLGRPVNSEPLRLSMLADLVRRRRSSPLDAACYLSVLLVDKLLARVRRGGPVSWGRDDGSRPVVGS